MRLLPFETMIEVRNQARVEEGEGPVRLRGNRRYR
jgi:hypothetical protein